MKKFPQELLDRIKAEIPASQVALEADLVLQEKGGRYEGLCPFHADRKTPSFTAYTDNRGWRCFGACDTGGDVIELYQRLHELSFVDAVKALQAKLDDSEGASLGPAAGAAIGRPAVHAAFLTPPDGPAVPYRHLWPYTLPSAEIYSYPGGDEVRYLNAEGTKRSVLCRPTPWGLVFGCAEAEYFQGKDGCWRQVKPKTPRKLERRLIAGRVFDLYRPDAWRGAGADVWVLNTEGPKDAETAIALGLPATTSPNGSMGFRPAHAKELVGRRVAVLADNDKAGVLGARKRAELLRDVAAAVRLVAPLGGEEGSGFDLSDWVAECRQKGIEDSLIRRTLALRIEQGEEISGQQAVLSEAQEAEHAACTDVQNAVRFLQLHGRRFLYCSELDQWLFWDGSRYRPDLLGQVSYSARNVSSVIRAEAERESDEKSRRKLLAWASTTEMQSRQRATVTLAKTDPELAVSIEKFDADPWVLVTPNGLLNLESDSFTEHSREPGSWPFVMKRIDVPYDQKAEAPRWRRFLREIFVTEAGEPDEELIAFLQRAVGYSLTGHTREQVFFLLHGEGSNGKSKFIDILATLCGDYSHTLQFESLLSRRYESSLNNPDVANLQGARVAWAVESAVTSRWNEALVKLLSGGDPITATRKYENPRTFLPTHKLWLATNHVPATYDSSVAWWRRVMLIPFSVTFKKTLEPDEASPHVRLADLDLEAKLEGELPGILNWAIEGCRQWRLEGLGSCAATERATEEYRQDQDPIGDFLEACCVLDPDASEAAKEIYEAFEKWCENNGQEPLKTNRFGRLLTEKGFLTGKSNGIRTRKGLRLLPNLSWSGSIGGPGGQAEEDEKYAPF